MRPQACFGDKHSPPATYVFFTGLRTMTEHLDSCYRAVTLGMFYDYTTTIYFKASGKPPYGCILLD